MGLFGTLLLGESLGELNQLRTIFHVLGQRCIFPLHLLQPLAENRDSSRCCGGPGSPRVPRAAGLHGAMVPGCCPLWLLLLCLPECLQVRHGCFGRRDPRASTRRGRQGCSAWRSRCRPLARASSACAWCAACANCSDLGSASARQQEASQALKLRGWCAMAGNCCGDSSVHAAAAHTALGIGYLFEEAVRRSMRSMKGRTK